MTSSPLTHLTCVCRKQASPGQQHDVIVDVLTSSDFFRIEVRTRPY